MRIAMLIIGMTSFLWAATVHAQAPVCVTGSPGSKDCEERALPDPEPVSTLTQSGSGNGYDRGNRHHDFFLPNGNLTKKGDLSLAIYELGMLNTLAYGVSDRIELSVSAPVYPLFLSLGIRVQLAPLRSRLRAVIEAHGWMPVLDDGGSDGDPYVFWTQIAGTVAYHGDNFDVHATLSGAIHSDDGFELPAANIGASLRVLHRFAILFNYTSLNTNDTWRCRNCINPRLNFVIFGLKHMGQTWDSDFGFAVCFDPDSPDDEFIPVPILSFQRNY